MKKKKDGKIYEISGIAYPSLYIYVSFIYIYICLSTEYCRFILHSRETTPILFVVKRNLN